ncbi:MAG: ArsC family reductase [Neisseria sicca]|nr:ArsC family reductase [Neisseria sicca]
MIQLYGIPNCDTVKKARKWLEEHGVDFQFVDFKKSPPQVDTISKWLEQIPLEVLLNKRGTTWRKLDEQAQAAAATTDGAVRLMAEQPSIIKRPVLEKEGRFFVGFSEENYQEIFSK